MSIAAVLTPVAGAFLRRILKQEGAKILDKVAGKGALGEVVETIAEHAGVEPQPAALEQLARSDPEAFSNAVTAAEKTNAARWSQILAETQSGYFFIAMARPSLLWACFAILLYAGIMAPVSNWAFSNLAVQFGFTYRALPAVEPVVWDTLVWLIPLLYAARGVEGIAGVKSRGFDWR